MNTYKNFHFQPVNDPQQQRITLTITKYLGSEKHVTIPSEIDGFPVTVLDHSVFADFSHIESVIFPDSLEKILDYTFSYCEKLQSLQLPSTVKSIGKRAFQHCTALEELTFHEGLTFINNECFRNCTNIKRIYFPKSLVGIGEQSFTDCCNLEEVSTHPDFVFRDRNHFSGCKKLWNHQGVVVINEIYLGVYGNFKELDVPEGIIELPPLLCSKYEKLERVSLPSSLERIGGGAFEDCKKLSQIDLPKKLKILPFSCFMNCVSLKKIVLPEALEEIESSCFRGCNKLEEIVWNEALRSIGEHAFHRTFLPVLPPLPLLKEIQRGAFTDCKNLTEVHFASSLKTLGDGCFHLSFSLVAIYFQHSEAALNKLLSQRKNIFSYNPNLKKAPEQVVDTWTNNHKTSFRLHQFLHWEELDREHQDFFYKEWSENTEGNGVVDLIFFEGAAKEMAYFLQLGFPLSLPQVDEYLDHQIHKQNTAAIAILLEYKKNRFTPEELNDFETNKDLIDMGFLLPTLAQLKRKWKVLVDKNGIHLQNYIGNRDIAYLPDSTSEGTPLFYPKYLTLQMLRSGKNLSPLSRIIFSSGEEIDLINETSSLKELQFPPDMSYIDAGFCENMEYLETVTLPNDLGRLFPDSFSNCPNLKTVIFQNLPRNIAHSAFDNCPSLAFFGTEEGENYLYILE